MKSTLVTTHFIVALLFSTWIANASFAPPIKLSTNEVETTMNENMGQCIVADPINNYVHVVWADAISATDSGIFYKRSSDGGATWGNDIRLSPPSVLDSDPLMAACGSYVHVVHWRNPYNTATNASASPPTYNLYMSSSDYGVTWSTEWNFGVFAFWPGLACSGSTVYINMNNVSSYTAPYNTEVYFMKSSDNGTTWSSITQISNAAGRSEDPAMSASGSNVYMVWNDNRLDGTHLQLYFRGSNDYGATWGNETALSALPLVCYSPTVVADGSNVHAFFANTGGSPIIVNYVQSTDNGHSFTSPTAITTVSGSWYPSAAAQGTNLHVIFGRSGDHYNYYTNSTDTGSTWSTPVTVGTWPSTVTFTPASFIALQGSTVHLAWSMLNATGGHHAIYYTNDPNANSFSSSSSSSSSSPTASSSTSSTSTSSSTSSSSTSSSSSSPTVSSSSTPTGSSSSTSTSSTSTGSSASSTPAASSSSSSSSPTASSTSTSSSPTASSSSSTSSTSVSSTASSSSPTSSTASTSSSSSSPTASSSSSSGGSPTASSSSSGVSAAVSSDASSSSSNTVTPTAASSSSAAASSGPSSSSSSSGPTSSTTAPLSTSGASRVQCSQLFMALAMLFIVCILL